MGGVLVDLSRERSVRQFKALGVSDASDLINPYSHNGLFGSLENGDITTLEFLRPSISSIIFWNSVNNTSATC